MNELSLCTNRLQFTVVRCRRRCVRRRETNEHRTKIFELVRVRRMNVQLFHNCVSTHTHAVRSPYTTEFSIFPSRIHTQAPHTYTTALFTHIVYLCQSEAQQTHSLIRTCYRHTQANEKQQIAAATALQPEKRMKNVRLVERQLCVCL